MVLVGRLGYVGFKNMGMDGEWHFTCKMIM